MLDLGRLGRRAKLGVLAVHVSRLQRRLIEWKREGERLGSESVSAAAAAAGGRSEGAGRGRMEKHSLLTVLRDYVVCEKVEDGKRNGSRGRRGVRKKETRLEAFKMTSPRSGLVVWCRRVLGTAQCKCAWQVRAGAGRVRAGEGRCRLDWTDMNAVSSEHGGPGGWFTGDEQDYRPADLHPILVQGRLRPR